MFDANDHTDDPPEEEEGADASFVVNDIKLEGCQGSHVGNLYKSEYNAPILRVQNLIAIQNPTGYQFLLGGGNSSSGLPVEWPGQVLGQLLNGRVEGIDGAIGGAVQNLPLIGSHHESLPHLETGQNKAIGIQNVEKVESKEEQEETSTPQEHNEQNEGRGMHNTEEEESQREQKVSSPIECHTAENERGEMHHKGKKKSTKKQGKVAAIQCQTDMAVQDQRPRDKLDAFLRRERFQDAEVVEAAVGPSSYSQSQYSNQLPRNPPSGGLDTLLDIYIKAAVGELGSSIRVNNIEQQINLVLITGLFKANEGTLRDMKTLRRSGRVDCMDHGDSLRISAGLEFDFLEIKYESFELSFNEETISTGTISARCGSSEVTVDISLIHYIEDTYRLKLNSVNIGELKDLKMTIRRDDGLEDPLQHIYNWILKHFNKTLREILTINLERVLKKSVSKLNVSNEFRSLVNLR